MVQAGTPVIVTQTPVASVKTVSFWAHLGSIGLAALGVVSTVSGALGGFALPPPWGVILTGAGLVATKVLQVCGQPVPTLAPKVTVAS